MDAEGGGTQWAVLPQVDLASLLQMLKAHSSLEGASQFVWLYGL